VSEESARPQDLGRAHRRTRPGMAPETAEVLERYRGAMRAELGDCLIELRPEREQLTLTGGAERIRPALAERVKLWDLAIKLGRELGAPGSGELEEEPPASSSATSSSRPARAPRISAKERRSLGG